jgi:predicted dehydrogenase
MAEKVGIGIIGCGMIAGSHIRGYLELAERAQMLAVCDVVKENAEKRAESIVTEAKRQAKQAAEKAKETKRRFSSRSARARLRSTPTTTIFSSTPA